MSPPQLGASFPIPGWFKGPIEDTDPAAQRQQSVTPETLDQTHLRVRHTENKWRRRATAPILMPVTS